MDGCGCLRGPQAARHPPIPARDQYVLLHNEYAAPLHVWRHPQQLSLHHSYAGPQENQFHETSGVAGAIRRARPSHAAQCAPSLGQGSPVDGRPTNTPHRTQQFSDYERAQFLNHALKMLWPAVDAKLSL